MKIKENCVATSSDFWYDLAHGGYLKPAEILESQKDIDEVNDAIEVLREFERSCEEQIENFVQ